MDTRKEFLHHTGLPRQSWKWLLRGLAVGLICLLSLLSGRTNCVAKTAAKVQSAYPLPYAVRNLPTIVAKPWLRVEKSGQGLIEGPVFDKAGNLYISSIFDSRILKISPNKKVKTIFQRKGLLPDGLAIHHGKLFIACLSGALATIDLNGTHFATIDLKYEGAPRSCNDLVFNKAGDLYVTDFTGTNDDPTGGVYWISSDLKTIKPVMSHMGAANGVGLSPKGNVLWVDETTRNLIDRIELLKDGVTINPIAGAGIPYRFSGGPGGCDSFKIDQAGNLYVDMIFQGRIVVLNRHGIPIANVVVPGRDKGMHLRTTNLAFKPGTNEAYWTTDGKGGAWIFRFKGLAKGERLYQ